MLSCNTCGARIIWLCLYKFGARDSWLNNWEHRGEDMYCPQALLKIPGSGTTFFFPLRTTLLHTVKTARGL